MLEVEDERTRLRAGLNDGLFQKLWTFSDNCDFTVCIIRCVYRAQLILGTVYLSNKDPCPKILVNKSEIKVP